MTELKNKWQLDITNQENAIEYYNTKQTDTKSKNMET